MSEYSKAKKYLKKNILSKERYKHSLSVSKIAGKLAKKWGVNSYDAKLAGLLHDLAREKGMYEARCYLKPEDFDRFGDYDSPKMIYHGPCAAKISKHFFNISDQIYETIYYHTLINDSPNTLTKIIFIADEIEPRRKHESASINRKLAFKDLDYCLYKILDGQIEYLESLKRPVLGDTYKIYNRLKEVYEDKKIK